MFDCLLDSRMYPNRTSTRNIFCYLIAGLLALPSYGNGTGVLFEENKGQWPSQVTHRTGIGFGTTLYFEKDRFTYSKYDPAQLEKIHDDSHERHDGHPKKTGTVNLHAFQMRFLGASQNVSITTEGRSEFYHNYFKGNDPAKWASEVYSYTKLRYENIYPGIAILAYSEQQFLKYDFIVSAGSDPSKIKMQFSGTNGLQLVDNKLVIKTTVGDVIENSPYTYQLINGKKVDVACHYQIHADGKTVTFAFPNSYNVSFPLIIDPILVGATFSGAPASCTTYGHCATYDPSGNIYTGGECFDPGYPVSVGAFQTTFQGWVDIAIGKLNPNGSTLLWATYIGGTNGDIPNSLFVPANGEIYILGASSSNNYPTSVGCFDPTYNGIADDDIVITHLNSTGTGLIGSTYVGGSLDDGGGWVPWAINGHDGMRGEIIVDPAGNAWIASFTSSANFPTSPGTYDNALGGTWDGVGMRLPANLSTLSWSTFLGGSADEGSYGCRVNQAGEFFVTGITQSANFPSTGGVYDPSYNGASDGYVTRFNAAGNAILASTFFGTAANEISYFMDMDGNGNPYIYGISQGAMPITPGVYSNPGSGNFVSKFNPTLTTLVFSTVFGDGSGWFLEPEAFMIDTCENLYMSGFGSTGTYPVSTNSLFPTQASVQGGSCYFIVLSKDALSLSYGSFYFGWHVDGGTSRFDPSGSIYQGICIGGGGANTPAWAWKNNVNAPGWDMFVVKIDFQMAGVNAQALIAPNDTICVGDAVTFTNLSNGVDFSWDFGDGSPLDTNAAPVHIYNTVGTYQVTFIAIDSTSCLIADTAFLSITVLPLPVVNLGNDTTVCGSVVFNIPLDAGTSGTLYNWSTGATTQIINVNVAGTYWVSVSNSICTATDTIKVVTLGNFTLGNDTSLCEGQPLMLDPGITGATYLWNTGATTQTIAVTTTGVYFVDITAAPCLVTDTISVTFIPLPTLNLPPDTQLCPGGNVTLNASGVATSYLWNTGATTQSINVNQAGTYIVTASNSTCTTGDTVIVTSVSPVMLGADVYLCNLTEFTLDAGNSGASYLWNNGENTQTITVTEQGQYWVEVNLSGCLLTDTIEVSGSLGDGVLYFPNTFTPNSDAHNEYFTGYGTDITYFHLQIFNRWGDLIFETKNQFPGWDGRLDGLVSQEDVYVWKVEYQSKCSEGRTLRKLGHVAIIR